MFPSLGINSKVCHFWSTISNTGNMSKTRFQIRWNLQILKKTRWVCTVGNENYFVVVFHFECHKFLPWICHIYLSKIVLVYSKSGMDRSEFWDILRLQPTVFTFNSHEVDYVATASSVRVTMGYWESWITQAYCKTFSWFKCTLFGIGWVTYRSSHFTR